MHFVIWPNASKRSTSTLVLMEAIVFLISCSPVCFAQSGLVAAYGFDETSGTSVQDSSGNNLTGTIVGATRITGGMYGGALSFNGASSYLDLGNPAALRLTGSMTIEAWVKAAANPSNDALIVSKSTGPGWQLKTSADTGPRTFGLSVQPLPRRRRKDIPLRFQP